MDFTQQDRATLTRLLRERLGRTPVRIEAMAAGMGTRRFHRVFLDGEEPSTLIARIEDDGASDGPNLPVPSRVPDAPPWLAEPTLEPIRGFLEEAGLPVPRSFLHAPVEGIDLLEDVGDQTLGDAPGSQRAALYGEACGLVARLQDLDGDASLIPAFARTLDRRLLETKRWKWLNWMIPLILDRPASPLEVDQMDRLFQRIAELVEAAPLRLSHRDFKAENLHLHPARPTTTGRLVMIDIQGAFMAPPEYDLVCLLYDLQANLEEAFVQTQFESTRDTLPDHPGAEEARMRFDALAIARLCKDLSHVVHAGRVRGDSRRWRELPRGLELLRRAAGRLEHTFPETESLLCVIQALTPRVLSADSDPQG